MKKSLILLAAVCFLIFGGACFTPELYKHPAEDSRTLFEEVSSFLITQDGKNLIVVGKQHHYIFTANDTLKFILTSPEKKRVKAVFNDFSISSDQSVYGSYTLTVPLQGLPAETTKLLIAKGFTNNPTQKNLIYQGSVQGTRYLADKFQLPATMLLNQKYTITMHESYASASATIERILLTPLAIAADGLLILGGIPVLIFVGIFD